MVTNLSSKGSLKLLRKKMLKVSLNMAIDQLHLENFKMINRKGTIIRRMLIEVLIRMIIKML